MPQFRPSSNQKPGDQYYETLSGKEIPMAMSMMVDSMVRMIQKANHAKSEIKKKNNNRETNDN